MKYVWVHTRNADATAFGTQGYRQVLWPAPGRGQCQPFAETRREDRYHRAFRLGKVHSASGRQLLETIDSGSISFEGRDVGYQQIKGKLALDKPKNICKLRTQIGMVFQHFNLFPHMTVVENAMEGPVTVLGMAKEEARVIAMSMLEKVGMSSFADRFPASLSGGQKQRVAIARALSMQPKLMLFDEPTSALDPELVGEVFGTIKQLADEGMTMIIVTHNMGFAREVADQVVFMEDGSFLAKGTPDEFFNQQCKDPRIQSFIDRIFLAADSNRY